MSGNLPSEMELGSRTKSINEWKTFKKSSEWLDIMDFIDLECSLATEIMMDDKVNQKDFKAARDKRSAFQYLSEIPDLIISEIQLEKETEGKSTNIIENNMTGDSNE